MPRGRRQRAGAGRPKPRRRKTSLWALLLPVVVIAAIASVVVLARWRPPAARPAAPPRDEQLEPFSADPARPAPRAAEVPAPPALPAPLAAPEAAPPRPAATPEARTPPASDAAPATRAPVGGPRVAIVIDDCGQRLELMQRAVRMRQSLTFAVIPRLPHSRASAEAAFAAGHEVILHQPMEPEQGDEDPGEGALKVGMRPADVERVLRENFADVPHAVGLNNHMGSRATADERLMAATFHAVKDLSRGRPLYFLDSRTTAQTVAEEAAHAAGLASGRRAVFLDNDPSPRAIRDQMATLLATARDKGEAVGIGHLRPETLDVLEVVLPREESDVSFVFLSALMR
jgi:polysaccharide deacetylase 2 family uncharacterized protein YibQ